MDDRSPVCAAVVCLARVGKYVGHGFDPLASEEGGQRHCRGDCDVDRARVRQRWRSQGSTRQARAASSGAIGNRLSSMTSRLNGPQAITSAVCNEARVPGEDGSLEDIIARADAALYDAKRSGRNRVAPAD